MRKALLCALLYVAGGCSRSNDAMPFGLPQPAESTRARARRLSLQQIKEVRLVIDLDPQLQQMLTVINPKVIAQLIEGLKTAKKTNIKNQTSNIQVIGKNGRTLLSESFSTAYILQALSLEFDKGLRQAGANLSWSRADAESRWKELSAEANRK